MLPRVEAALERSYREASRVEAERDRLRAELVGGAPARRHHVTARLQSLRFHHKVLLSTIAAIEAGSRKS